MAHRPRYRTVLALHEILNEGASHETFSTHALRHQIRQAQRNGLAPAIRRLGRKVLIDEIGYRIWLATGQAPGHADD
jgi:hypothetical protein